MPGARSSRHLAWLAQALYAGAALLALQDAARHPTHNWDMIAYIGAVLQRGIDDPVRLHQETYAVVRAGVPPAAFADLTRQYSLGNNFRSQVFSDPVAFAQQLPFYTVKPLYVSLLGWAARGSPDPVAAAHRVSLVAFALCLVVLPFCCPANGPRSLWLVVLVPLLHLGTTPIRSVAAIATPDALSLLLLAVTFWLLLARHAPHAALAVATISIAARPDNVILEIALLAYLATVAPPSERISRLHAAGWAAAALLLTVYIDRQFGAYSWSQMVSRGVIDTPARPADQIQGPIVDLYLASLRDGLTRMMLQQPREVAMLLAGFVVFALSRWIPAAEQRYGALALVASGSMVVRILAYPQMAERYFYFYYLLIAAAAVGVWSTARTAVRSSHPLEVAPAPPSRIREGIDHGRT